MIFDDAAINALDPEKRTVLVTTHRRENLGEPMRSVPTIRDLINEFEDIQVYSLYIRILRFAKLYKRNLAL